MSLNARISQKHDTETNWNKAVNFAPKAGELIVYDVDASHSSPRFKIGDGTTKVSSLPFVIPEKISDSIIEDVAAGNAVTSADTYLDLAGLVTLWDLIEDELANTGSTDTQVNVTLDTTTKAYLLGTTTTPTSTASGTTAVADTGVYLDTTAGKLTATSFSGSGSSLTSLNASNISSGTLAAARLATSGATAGTYGPTANATPAHGASFDVPSITVDNKGRVTSASTKTVTLPASDAVTYSTDAPAMDGTASAGSADEVARADHVHPTDISRVPTSRTVNGKALSSNITLDASDVGAAEETHTHSASDITSGTLSADRLATSGATAGSYGPSADASPAHGGTFSVPYVTVDAKGRVTAASTKTITLPTDNDTNTKVNTTLATTTKAYVLGTSTTPTSTAQAVTTVADTGVYLDTTAGKLTATSFAGSGASLTSLNGSNISSGTVPAARLPAMSGASSSSAGTKGAVPAPSAGDQDKYLKGDGTWGTVSATVSTMTGATSSAAGTSGSVPAPSAGANMKFLRGDGTWEHPASRYYSSTTSSSGVQDGENSTASGTNSHAEGTSTASGTGAHAEGYATEASGNYSHAEGYSTNATGQSSHAEGQSTNATGYYSHAEGYGTTASYYYAHAEGRLTTASGENSHAEGFYTEVRRKSQHAFGEYNEIETGSNATKGTYVEIVGNGTGTSARSNARTLDWSGNEVLAGTLSCTGIIGSCIATNAEIDALFS